MGENQSFNKIAVVIVNWERPEDTIQCINSVMNSDYPNLEIILVDNGSKDDSLVRFREAYDQINIIELTENEGFTGGYNAGIRKADEGGADYVFLLNNDTIIDKNSLSLLLDAGWDISVPKITFYDSPTTIWAAGARWRSIPPTIKMIGYQKPDGPEYNSSRPLDYTTGCALLVKKEVFDKILGFDPRYINYMEDYDFSYRAREAGFTIGYVPQASVLHKVSRSLGEGSEQRWEYLGRNTVLFYRHPARFPGVTLWIVLGWVLLREIFNGNARYLPAFWDGVNDGLTISKGDA